MDIRERNEKYKKYVSAVSPHTCMFWSLCKAFFVGGLICVIGQGFYMLYESIFTYKPEHIAGLVSSTLVLIASILTGLGVWDKIGVFGGGGAFVPITGFSNSITAAAIEHRKEGIVFGTCANMFKIAGPVIVFGLALSMAVGLIYWIISLFV